MNDEMSELRTVTRARVGRIWQLAQAGEELDGEEAQLAEVMEMHPEYYDVWQDVESLGPDAVTPDGVNPFLHVATHQVVEQQLADNDPPQTVKTLEALMAAGYSRHDATHAIGAVVMQEVFDILKEKRPFDRERYVAALRDVAEEAKRQARRGSRGTNGRHGQRR